MAAPTIVQHKANQAAAGTSVSVTLASPVTAGNMLLLFCSANSSATFSTPTMTGETFTKITAASVKPAAASEVQTYFTASAVGGQTVVTATQSGCSGCGTHLHVFEISGQDASPIDATGTASNVTGTYTVSTTATTTNATDLVIVYFYDDDGEAIANNVAAGTGYTKADETDCADGNTGCGESKSTTTTGIQTATTSGWANTTDRVSAGIVAIKPPAGGATGINIPYMRNPGGGFGMGF